MEIKTKIDSQEAMQKEQPNNTILIDGIELPTYQKHYEDREKIRSEIKFLKRENLVQSIFIIILALALLLK